MYKYACTLSLLWIGVNLSNVQAQASDPAPLRTWQAVRLTQASPIVDGRLDDAVWRTAQVTTGFTQRRPKPGAPATQRSEARLLYDDDALYVYARLYDTAPDSIEASLFRRDDRGGFSDWFYIQFDSYHDRRTAFSFAVNPRGVQKDFIVSDDVNEDTSWDAVWLAAAQVQEDGWTAEMRIPLSQLRFPSSDEPQTWGVNMQRRIGRNGETSYWSPTPPDASGLVSQFGDLNGIMGLVPSRRLELQPYTAAKVARLQGDPTNPFFKTNNLSGNTGLDLKYGLTSNLTLSATFSPDFGQVEVDPAVVNLSAFESFFSEKRPFFLEGSDIFEFGNTRNFNSFGRLNVFYSRRIGRNPQRSLSGDEIDFVESPELTTIAAAAKVSGKTAGGWSVGLLNAVTPLETATFQRPDGSRGRARVEPATNYLVTRLRKDYRGGQTVIGGMLTGVNRKLDDPALQGLLCSSAYTAGVDFEHAFANRTYTLSGFLVGSRIAGEAEVIDAAQRSSARYFQRPDVDYVDYDPTRTSLSGYSGQVSLMKTRAQHWRYSLTYQETNPGFEVNDLGFLRRADERAFSTALVYEENEPGATFRTYELWAWTTHAYNFGGQNLFTGYGSGGWAMFNNQWTINYNLLLFGAMPSCAGNTAPAQQSFWSGSNSVASFPRSANLNWTAMYPTSFGSLRTTSSS